MNSQKESRPDDAFSEMTPKLRTPMASIMGLGEIILRETGPDAAGEKESTSIVKQQRKRFDYGIDALSEHSLIEKSRSIDTEQNIVSLTSLVLHALEDRIAAESLSVKTEFLQPSISVSCNRDRFVQVLVLLLSNAIDSAPDDGTLTVGACLTDTMVQFWVSDDGPGIPLKDIPLIFQKPQCAGSSDDERNKFAIRFAQAKKILELDGGTIGVQSKELEATTFKVTLPLSA